MLPDVTLPASLAVLLGALRPCFTAPSFATFCGLAAGLAGQVRRRTVCGMLLGAELSLNDDVAAVIERQFANPDTAYLHAHNAAYGCFAARIDRG